MKATLQELKEAKRILNGLSTANLLPGSVTTPLLLILAHWIADAERKPEPKPASSECQCKMMQPTHRTSPGTLYEVVCDTCGLGVSPAVGLRICDTCGGIITNAVWERWSKVEEFYFGAWHWKELISVLFPKGESIYAFIGGNTFTVTRGGKVILCLTAKEMAEMPEIKP